MSTSAKLMLVAASAAVISMIPGAVLAQTAPDTPTNTTASPAPYSWDFALIGGTGWKPFDSKYIGATAQYALRRGPWWWIGGQAGALGSISGVVACDAIAGARCITAPDGLLYVAPLGGVGVRKGPLLLRATAGPRITVNSSSPLRGAQASGELSLGNDRGALFVPFTWSRSRHDDQTLDLRTIGIGIQLR
ncbi:hypothetical protein [Gemmatimonas sp.]